MREWIVDGDDKLTVFLSDPALGRVQLGARGLKMFLFLFYFQCFCLFGTSMEEHCCTETSSLFESNFELP